MLLVATDAKFADSLLKMLADRLDAIRGISDLGINCLDWCSLLCDS